MSEIEQTKLGIHNNSNAVRYIIVVVEKESWLLTPTVYVLDKAKKRNKRKTYEYYRKSI